MSIVGDLIKKLAYLAYRWIDNNGGRLVAYSCYVNTKTLSEMIEL